jgi:hypothetical protein
MECPPPIKRAAGSSSASEAVTLALTTAGCCFTAYLLWQMINRIPPPANLLLDPASGEWRVLLLLALLAFPGLFGITAMSYLNRALATSTQSLMYLQDQVWLEQRREQGRANRFLFGARLRAQRKKEKP